jgi:hypothetical protein
MLCAIEIVHKIEEAHVQKLLCSLVVRGSEHLLDNFTTVKKQVILSELKANCNMTNDPINYPHSPTRGIKHSQKIGGTVFFDETGKRIPVVTICLICSS